MTGLSVGQKLIQVTHLTGQFQTDLSNAHAQMDADHYTAKSNYSIENSEDFAVYQTLLNKELPQLRKKLEDVRTDIKALKAEDPERANPLVQELRFMFKQLQVIVRGSSDYPFSINSYLERIPFFTNTCKNAFVEIHPLLPKKPQQDDSEASQSVDSDLDASNSFDNSSAASSNNGSSAESSENGNSSSSSVINVNLENCSSWQGDKSTGGSLIFGNDHSTISQNTEALFSPPSVTESQSKHVASSSTVANSSVAFDQPKAVEPTSSVDTRPQEEIFDKMTQELSLLCQLAQPNDLIDQPSIDQPSFESLIISTPEQPRKLSKQERRQRRAAEKAARKAQRHTESARPPTTRVLVNDLTFTAPSTTRPLISPFTFQPPTMLPAGTPSALPVDPLEFPNEWNSLLTETTENGQTQRERGSSEEWDPTELAGQVGALNTPGSFLERPEDFDEPVEEALTFNLPTKKFSSKYNDDKALVQFLANNASTFTKEKLASEVKELSRTLRYAFFETITILLGQSSLSKKESRSYGEQHYLDGQDNTLAQQGLVAISQRFRG